MRKYDKNKVLKQYYQEPRASCTENAEKSCFSGLIYWMPEIFSLPRLILRNVEPGIQQTILPIGHSGNNVRP